MPGLNFNIRIFQIVGLILLALFVVKLTQWEQGLWIAVSVTAIVGPFSTSLALEKARNRIIGTLVGLVLATILEVFLRYNYETVFIVGVLLAYCLGFAVQQNYRFFIMVVTVAVCLNFEYMNMPFTSFEPISFLVARFIAVLMGITLFLLVQKYIYGDKNARKELSESALDCARMISKKLSEHLAQERHKINSSLEIAMELKEKSKYFETLLAASNHGIHPSSDELKVAKKIGSIKTRIIFLLLDNSSSEKYDPQSQTSSAKHSRERLIKIQKSLASYVNLLDPTGHHETLG